MNIRLLLVLGFVVGSAWMSRDTISTGFSLLTGRFDPGYSVAPSIPGDKTPGEDGLTDYEREFIRKSDERIRLWRDCTYTHYYEENKDECDRLHASVNR